MSTTNLTKLASQIEGGAAQAAPAAGVTEDDGLGIPDFLDRKKHPELNRPRADKLPVPPPIQERKPTKEEKLEAVIKREAGDRFRHWSPTEDDIRQAILKSGDRDAKPQRPPLSFFERQVREERAPSTLKKPKPKKPARAAGAVPKSKAAQPKQAMETDMKTKTAAKPAARKPAAKPKTHPRRKAASSKRSPAAARSTTTRPDGLREGSKMAVMIDMVLDAKGATEAEICKRIGWEACRVTLKRAAEKAGVKLTAKPGDDGKTRYFGKRSKG